MVKAKLKNGATALCLDRRSVKIVYCQNIQWFSGVNNEKIKNWVQWKIVWITLLFCMYLKADYIIRYVE